LAMSPALQKYVTNRKYSVKEIQIGYFARTAS